MKTRKFLSVFIAIIVMVGAFSVCTYAEENPAIEYSVTVNGESYYYSEVAIKLNEALEIQIADVTVEGQPVDQNKISYTWEKSSPAPDGRPGLVFEELAGENESIYSASAYDGTQRYRCTVTVDGVGTRSKEIWLKEDSLTVAGQSSRPFVLNDEDGNYHIKDLQVGDEVTLTINATSTISGAAIAYKWSGINGYIQPDSELEEFFDITNDTNSLTVTKTAGEQTYFCEVSDGQITKYVYFMLDSIDTITDDIQINGEHPGIYAGTHIYVIKPGANVTISIPSTSTKGDIEYTWYYDAEGAYSPVRLDRTTNTITVTKSGFTETNPYAWEVYQCFLEDGNERVRYWVMLFCLDPEKPLSEIKKIGEETPGVEIKTQNEDLANTVLNGDELKALSAGAPMEVTLTAELKQTVSQAEKSAIEEKLAANSNVGMYLDINLFKGFEGDPSQVSELDKSIEISVDMPESLINKKDDIKRQYSVVRVHNGVAETIPCAYDAATNTIDFSSDRFSTYTIVYTDTAIENPTDDTLGNSQPGTQVPDKDQENQTEVPATGDTAATGLWLALLMVSGLALVTSLTLKKVK